MQSVYYTRIGASLGLFVAGFLIAWLFITLNILLARRLEPFGLVGTPPEQIAAAFGVRIPMVLIAAAGVFAFFMGLGIAGDWQQVLLYFNQVPFGVTDPIFGRDVSFFVFTLEVWELLRGWLFLLLLATLAAVASHGRRRLARLERARAGFGCTWRCWVHSCSCSSPGSTAWRPMTWSTASAGRYMAARTPISTPNCLPTTCWPSSHWWPPCCWSSWPQSGAVGRQLPA